MVPIFSSQLSDEELKNQISRVRRCNDCHTAYWEGGECNFCTGGVNVPLPRYRKEVPEAMLDLLRVEKPIDMLRYHPTQEQEISVKVEESLPIEDERVVVFHQKAPRHDRPCALFDYCGNKTRPGYQTCSRLCTTRLKSSFFEKGKLVVPMTVEEAQERLSKQKGSEAIAHTKV